MNVFFCCHITLFLRLLVFEFYTCAAVVHCHRCIQPTIVQYIIIYFLLSVHIVFQIFGLLCHHQPCCCADFILVLVSWACSSICVACISKVLKLSHRVYILQLYTIGNNDYINLYPSPPSNKEGSSSSTYCTWYCQSV